MRRLLPLIAIALLALPASAHARVPAPPAHRTDAAATKALVAGAPKMEACRTRTLNYLDCDERAPAKGVRIESTTAGTYTLYARSKPGRRFYLGRGPGGTVAATCTPVGRGACPRSGLWKPRPMPVMNPAFGTEWLAHEYELVERLLAVADLIERCGAATGDFERCLTPEVEAAARWDMLVLPYGGAFEVSLSPRTFYVRGMARSATHFTYTHMTDGSVVRHCTKLPPVVSPCDGERW